MLIGTDVSISTCIAEGYTIMDFDPRKWKKCEAIPADLTFEFFQTATPENLYTRDTNPRKRSELVATCKDRNLQSTTATITDLLEVYTRHKAALDSFCGGSFPTNPGDYKTAYQALHLADTIISYLGMDF